MEDHVGGDALFPGLGGAPGAEGLEDGEGLLGEVDDGLALAAARACGRAGPAAPGRGGLLGLLAEADLAAAAEHLARLVGEDQRAVLPLDGQQSLGQQLAHGPAPLALAQLLADAEDGELVVVELDDLGRLAAHQDVDDLAGAELLVPLALEADHGGHGLLRGDRAVPGLRRGEAGVAVAAVLAGGLLAEVAEQLGAAALGGLAEGEHRVQVGLGAAPVRLVPLAGLDELALLHDVLEAVRHPGRGGAAVAARAAGLLVVPLDRLRQVEVGDEADVGLVDAHAEGDGGDDDQAVLAQEPGLVGGAGPRVEPRVVRDGLDPVVAEEVGGALDRVAREAVDDARVARVLSLRKVRSCFFGSFLGTIRYWMLGRSKLATKCLASGRASRRVISWWVASVAVAVRATRGTSGQRSPRTERAR